jgi:hypothetical protein
VKGKERERTKEREIANRGHLGGVGESLLDLFSSVNHPKYIHCKATHLSLHIFQYTPPNSHPPSTPNSLAMAIGGAPIPSLSPRGPHPPLPPPQFKLHFGQQFIWLIEKWRPYLRWVVLGFACFLMFGVGSFSCIFFNM